MVYRNQSGLSTLLVLFAVLGFAAFIMYSAIGQFQTRTLNTVYEKPSSLAAEPTSSSPFGTAALFQADPNAYIARNPITFTTQAPLTVEARFRPEATFDRQTIFAARSVSGTCQRPITLDIIRQTNTVNNPAFIAVFGYQYGGSFSSIQDTQSLPYGQWTHIAATVDATNRVALYVNGRLAATQTMSSALCSYSADAWIGTVNGNYPSTSRQPFKGLIDEVRVSNTVRYSSGFSVPTTSFTPDTNTVALWHLDGAADDASGMGNTGQVIGNVQFVDPNSAYPLPTPTVVPTPTATPTPLPADNIAPSVSITSPANNARVGRGAAVTVMANASDNVGVTKVEFFVNNSLLCADAAAPYGCVWTVPAGRRDFYTLTAKAYDAAGNTKTASVTVSSN